MGDQSYRPSAASTFAWSRATIAAGKGVAENIAFLDVADIVPTWNCFAPIRQMVQSSGVRRSGPRRVPERLLPTSRSPKSPREARQGTICRAE